MSDDTKFDLKKVNICFQNSLLDDEDDIITDHYLEGFCEINKFFQALGSVFGFVSSDVKAKIEILQELRQKENGDEFVTIKKMIEYEKSNGLLSKSNYVSGCRTLLRLHRGLEFVREFLAQLSSLSPDDTTSHACQNAYNCTLAKHHPWIIRTGAVMAMYTLPTREQLLKKVCTEHDEAILVLPDMLQVTKIVHERTHNLYTVHKLHELP